MAQIASFLIISFVLNLLKSQKWKNQFLETNWRLAKSTEWL